MSKTRSIASYSIILLLILSVLSIGANAAAPIALYSDDISIVAGQQGQMTISIENLESHSILVELYTIAVFTEQQSQDVIVFQEPDSGTNININTGDTHELTLTFDIPLDQTPGTYTARFYCEGVDIGVKETTLSVVVEEPVFELDMDSEIFFEDIDRGATDSDIITITNTGNSELTNIQIDHNIPVDYSTWLSKTSIPSLLPGDSQDIQIEITVPNDIQEGTSTIGSLTAQADQTASGATMIKVLPKTPEITIGSDGPINIVAGTQGKLTITLENEGNGQGSVDYQIEPFIQTLELPFNEPATGTIDLNPGETKDIELTFDAPQDAQNGVYSSNILLSGDSEDAMMLQVEIVPAQRSLETTPQSINFDSAVKQTPITQTFTIKNTGNVDIEKIYLGTDADLDVYNADLDQVYIATLSPDEEQEVELEITLPADFGDEERTLGNILVTLSDHEQLNTNLAVTARPAVPNVAIESDSPATILEGTSGTLEMKFTNTGDGQAVIGYNIPEFTYVFNNTNYTIDFNEAASNTITLAPGDQTPTEETITLTFDVPMGQLKGIYSADVEFTGDYEEAFPVQVSVEEETPVLTTEPAPILFDNAKRGTTVSKTFVIKNTGNIDQNNINLAFSGIGAQYAAKLDTTDVGSLAVGDYINATINITVPNATETGTYTIGKLNMTSDEGNFLEDISVTVESMLKIIDFEVKNEGDTKDLNEDDQIEDVKPDDTLEFTIEVENGFDADADKSTIEDVRITVTIDSLDEGSDVDEHTSRFDIDAEDTESKELQIQVPLVAEEGIYDLRVEARGTDENGIVHTDVWELELRVEKSSHDLRITKALLTGQPYTCGDTVKIDTEIMNFGKDRETDVVLKIESPKLDFDSEDDVGKLTNNLDDDESSYSRTFSFTVADDMKDGDYAIYVRAYRDDDSLEDQQELTASIIGCVEEDVPEKEGAQTDREKDSEQSNEDKVKESTSEQNEQSQIEEDGFVELLPSAGITGDAVATMTYDGSDARKDRSALFTGLIVLANLVFVLVVIGLIYKTFKN